MRRFLGARATCLESIVVQALALIVSGCSATLEVHGVSDPATFRGIRVRSPVSYVVTKRVVTEKCPPRDADEIVHLPIGDPYDVNFSPGLFASNEFSVQFNDSGVLKQVSLNSDPQVDETLTAAAALAEKVGGIAAASKEDCGPTKSEAIVSVRRLQVQ